MSIEKLLNAKNSLSALQDAKDIIEQAQAEKSKPTPLVTTLSGREIYEFGNLDPKDPNIDDKVFFNTVRDYYRANIQGKTITHPFLGEIEIRGSSWQKVKFGVPRNIDKTLAIPAILAALEHGKCSHIETGSKEQKKDFTHVAYILANVKINGRILEIGLSVAIDTLRKRVFYNISNNPSALKNKRDDHKYRKVKGVAGFDSSTIDEYDDVTASDDGLNIKILSGQLDDQLILEGRSNQVKTAKGTRLETNLAVIEAADLIASHDSLGNSNPEYPQELQPRDRSRQSSQQQIHNIAKELDPDSLGRSNRADSGAPIIGPDRVVESGNGRTIAIKLAYQQGKAEDYKAWIIENAEYFGFNPKQIETMKEPVLVRVRKTEVDRAQFAVEANQDDKLSYSATERAKSDAKRITGPLLELFSPDDSGNLLSASNMKFINGFLDSLGEHEAAQYKTTEGKPTQALLMRIKCAIFSKAYNDDRLLEMVADQTKPDLQNVLNALSISAPKFIETQSISKAMQGQIEDLSSGIVDSIEKSLDQRITNAILDATHVIEKARFNNQAVTEYVDQLGLFGDLPDGVAELAIFISTNARSAKKLSIAFKAMAQFAEKNAVDGQNYGLFGEPEPVSIKDAVAYANEQLLEQYGDEKSQINMFDDSAGFEIHLASYQKQNPAKKLKEIDARSQPLNALKIALDCLLYRGTEPAFPPINPVVTYTTKKGKTLEGIVIPFETVKYKNDAADFDPYTFQFDHKGWFIRLKHIQKIDNTLLTPEQILLKEGKYYATDSIIYSSIFGSTGGRTRDEASSNDGRSSVSGVPGTTSGEDDGSGDNGNGTAGVSENDVASSGAGSDKKSSGTRRRSIATTDFTTDDSKRSNVDDGPGSSTRRKRDRSIVQSAKNVRTELSGKALLQEQAEGTPTDWADIDNVRQALPYLLAEQQDDVHKTEDRLIVKNENGILFTNGTGTGKTFTGLGAVKRFANAGKSRILIVTLNDKIVRDFVKSAKALHLNVHQLTGIGDNGGDKNTIVATTYANFAQNPTLADHDWDLIVVDESHTLMQSEDGVDTGALKKLRALTGHYNGFSTWFEDRFRTERPPVKMVEVPDLDQDGNQLKNPDGTYKTKIVESKEYVEGPESKAWFAKQANERNKWLSRWNEQKGLTKVVFLSATPWSYVKTIEWAEGYLFHYTDPKVIGTSGENHALRYNSGNDKQQFFMRNFGYTMRYNKMTRPDGKVNSGVNEREFANKLKKEGAISGRELDVPFDYDRKFILIKSAIGQEIDRGIDILWSEKLGDGNYKYGNLLRAVLSRFNYLSRERLLEAIKADAVVDQIKMSVALGCKVVVFHDYNDGGGFSPFNFDGKTFSGQNDAGEILSQYEQFKREHPDLVNMNLSFSSPIATIKSTFPNALLFNGRVSKSERAKNADLFNTDDNGYDIIVVQSDAGSTGISFHDTTGKHQRVIFNLGLPKRPTKLRQTEGRIYRVGQASNAIHRYLTTGTKWETSAFAQTIAQRAETVDNLAKGDDAAVSIRDAIISAYEDAEYFEPGENDGIGGKAYDEENARIARLTPFDRAMTYYYNKGKNRDKRANKIGHEWYATPEPLGLKMVQWAGVHKGDDVLEPSAGDGAIGRWIPEDANGTMIEPSLELSSRAQLANTIAKIENGYFEDHSTLLKYDAIVMNPPFGHAGSTALKHIIKAAKHLREGGRIVALVPTASNFDKGLENWQSSHDGKEFYTSASIALPASTFVNANTSVSTRIIILERHCTPADAPYMRNLDFSSKATNEELFEAIRDLDMAPRKLRDDESLMEYGLVMSPFRSTHILTGTGVTVPEIRDNLLANWFVYEVKNDPNSLECNARNTKKLLASLANVAKLYPQSKDGFDSWQHDGIFERISIDQIKVDLKKYIRREKTPDMQAPIVVQELGHTFVLISGYERYRLAKQKQEQLVPAIVLSNQNVIDTSTLAKAYRKTAIPLDPEVFAQNLLDVLDEEALRLIS